MSNAGGLLLLSRYFSVFDCLDWRRLCVCVGSSVDTLGGFSLHLGVPGGTKVCLLQRSPQPQPQPPAPRPRTSFPDTPIEDGGSYSSRTRILEGVRSRSLTGVSKSKGPWRPQACCGVPAPRGGRTHYTGAGALIIPRWAHSFYCDGGSFSEAPGTLEWDTCGNLVIGLRLSVRN